MGTFFGGSPSPTPRKIAACDMPAGRLGSGVVSTNSTWRMARSIPAAFKRVRCHLFNIDTANTIAGAKAQFSLSESLANVNKPTIGGVASDANWKQFLFAGSGTVTQPVAPSAGVPSITTSDWYDISSIAPTDGSTYPVIYADRYIPTGNTAQCGYATPGASWASYVNALAGNKHKYRFFSQIGVDAIANPAGFTVNAEQQFVVPMALEFEFANGIRSMMTFGDSTKEGKGNTPSDSAYCGSSIMVQALFDQTATPLVVCNFANDGQTSVVGYAKFQAMLAVSTPHVVYFQPWSANDGAYSALAAAAITRAANVVQLCQQKGCKLIMETPLPINAAGSAAISTAELNALRSMEFAFLSYASHDIRVLDMRDLHDPAKPGVWNVLYGNDALHPNAAGHTLQTQKLYAELSGM